MKKKRINVFATPENIQEVEESCINASQNENLNCDAFSDVTVTSLKLLVFIQSFHFPGLSDQTGHHIAPHIAFLDGPYFS